MEAMKSEESKKEIYERTVNYSPRIIKLYRELGRDNTGRILGKQLLGSRIAVGANVHEVQGGRSKRVLRTEGLLVLGVPTFPCR